MLDCLSPGYPNITTLNQVGQESDNSFFWSGIIIMSFVVLCAGFIPFNVLVCVEMLINIRLYVWVGNLMVLDHVLLHLFPNFTQPN